MGGLIGGDGPHGRALGQIGLQDRAALVGLARHLPALGARPLGTVVDHAHLLRTGQRELPVGQGHAPLAPDLTGHGGELGGGLLARVVLLRADIAEERAP